jgi:Protein of unknown function (DUF763)
MGMDWHSSGITTSVIGALKRGLTPLGGELGVHVCGGRGKHSRQTPAELFSIGERVGFDGGALADASRLVAKVDSAAGRRRSALAATPGPSGSPRSAIERRDVATAPGQSGGGSKPRSGGLLRTAAHPRCWCPHHPRAGHGGRSRTRSSLSLQRSCSVLARTRRQRWAPIPGSAEGL